MKMKKQILCLALPLLLGGLAGCSKGTKVENLEEKKAIVNDVAEGAAKNIGKSDLTFNLNLKVDGEVTLPEGKVKFDSFALEAEGEFDFPETLEKGSDIKNIKAHLGLETAGKITVTQGSVETKAECNCKFADFYLDEGIIYGDIYKNGFSDFLNSALSLGQELPVKSKLDFGSLIDPDSIIDMQEDFEAPEIPEELLNEVAIYVANDKFTFELDTREATFKDDAGVEHSVKDFYGVDLNASLVIDKEFHLKEVEAKGNLDVSKLDEKKQASGNLAVNLQVKVNRKDNPSVPAVSDKEAYKEFKLFGK